MENTNTTASEQPQEVKSETIWQKLKNKLFETIKSKEFIYSVLFTFAISLVAHGFAFLNASYSDDSLSELYNPVSWKVEIGRFISPLFFAIRGQVALHWIIGLLGTAWLALAVFIVIKTFNIHSKFIMLLIAGIFATNLTTTCLAGTYIQDFDVDMFSLFMATLAVYLWNNHKSWKGLLGAAICCCLCLGGYQGNIVVTISLIIMISILNLMKNKPTKQVLINGLKSLGVLVVGFALQTILSHLICFCYGTKLNGRVNIFWAFTSLSLSIIYKPFTHIVEVLQKNTYPDWMAYTIFAVFAIIIIAIFVKFLFSKTHTAGQKALCTALIVVMPYTMDMFNLFTAFSHDLMIFSFWLIPIFALLLLEEFNPFENINKQQLKTAANITISALMCLFVWSNIITANTLHVKKDLEQKSTLFLMTRVVSEMEDVNGYVAGETPVTFVGVGVSDIKKKGMEDVYNIMGAWHNYAITMDIYGFYPLYFEYVLNYPLNLCSEETHNEMLENEQVKQMPTFPEQNSVQIIDGIMVVKL